MSHEADFCGDRLRLHAFLRVVEEGLPKRPTRFRRRLLAVHDGLEGSNHGDPDRTDDAVTLVQKAAHEGPSNDVSVLDIVRSPIPEQPLPAPEEPALVTAEDAAHQGDCKQAECFEFTFNQRAEKRASDKSVVTATKAPRELRKISSTRNRRRLPVNELALLRTTSSDGLPQPSDADNIFAPPVAAGDPIEDSQVASCTSLGISYKLLAFYRVQKPQKQTPAGTPNAGSTKRSGSILRGQLGDPSSAQSNGAHHKKPSTSSFSIGSDGFVGAELGIQHKEGFTKIRNNINTARRKKATSASTGLVFASGHLPTPFIEHHVQALPVGRRMSYQAQARIHKRHLLSERALTEIQRALSERETRKRHDYDLRQCESLVRDQLSSVTAPTRRVSGSLNSKGS